jgi:hypothetical protein
MKGKAKINYFVDVVIGLGFLLSAVSGIVLLIAGHSGGFQGGRNPAYAQNLRLFSRFVWRDIHNWSSLIMAAGVLGHLVLHWNWLVCMTRNLFSGKQTKQTNADCTV